MKILYTISNDTTLGSGAGGHYYSLLALAKAMNQKHHVEILSFGNRVCKMYSNTENAFSYHHINLDIREIKVAAKKAGEFVDSHNITHIHSFDVQSHKISNLVSGHTGAKRVSTKPGGPSPNLWYPFCNDMVLFSGEDLKWFKKSHKFNRSNLYLIPNRHYPEADNTTTSSDLPGLKIEDEVVMSITRFNDNKLDQFHQAIKVAKLLKEQNDKIRLVLIGKIQNTAFFEEIQKAAPRDTLFYTDEIYTVNAGRFYNQASYAVASGRGVFEAISYNIPTFIPSQTSQYPVLLTKETANQLIYFNFSNRCQFDISKNKAFKDIQMLQDKNKDYKSFISKFYDENLNITSVTDEYEIIYNISSKAERNYFDRYKQAFVNKICFL